MVNHVKEIARMREHASFLGYEFLTWTFLLLDREDAKLEVERITKGCLFKNEVALVLGTRLTTCLFNHKEQKTSIASPILEDSHEVFASLKNGHLVEALALSFSFGEITVSLMLHAQDFAITQVKIKNNYENSSLSDEENTLSEQEKNREEIFLRMAAIEDAEAIVDALYGHFLDVKLDDHSFKSTLKAMREQIEKRLGHYLRQDRDGSAPMAALGMA